MRNVAGKEEKEGRGEEERDRASALRIKEGKITMLAILYIPFTERVNFKELIA